MTRIVHPWPPNAEAQLRELFAAGASPEEMARLLNRSRQAVMAKTKRLGLRFIARAHSPEFVAARFWEKVAIGPWPCWIWSGNRFSDGGGKFALGRVGTDRRAVQASRFSWEYFHGPIPEHLWVLHRCDNRSCVRPDHLFLGDPKDNTQDMIRKGRSKMLRGREHPVPYRVVLDELAAQGGPGAPRVPVNAGPAGRVPQPPASDLLRAPAAGRNRGAGTLNAHRPRRLLPRNSRRGQTEGA